MEETEETEENDDEFEDEEEVVTEEEEEDEKVHDSKASFYSFENKFNDSSIDDKELDVANTFDKRYKTQLEKRY